MRMDRLFHVLVLGGAAIGLSAGCDSGGGSGAGGDGAGGDPSTTGDEGGGGSGGTTASATDTGSGGTTSTGETTGTAGAGGSGGGLDCSLPASPDDPCGCPCCWAEDCSNDDPACCGAFCEGTCC